MQENKKPAKDIKILNEFKKIQSESNLLERNKADYNNSIKRSKAIILY